MWPSKNTFNEGGKKENFYLRSLHFFFIKITVDVYFNYKQGQENWVYLCFRDIEPYFYCRSVDIDVLFGGPK